MVRRRVWILFGMVALGLVALLLRLAWLQVLFPDRGLAEQSRRRQSYRVEIEPFRGDIRAREGEVLATDKLSFDVAVPYRRMRHECPRWLRRYFAAADYLGLEAEAREACLGRSATRWAVNLSRVSGVPLEEVLEHRDAVIEGVQRTRDRILRFKPHLRTRRSFRIKEETVPQVVLRNVSFEAVSRILARPEAYPDLVVNPVRRRFYPMGRLACHVLGRLTTVERGREPPEPPGEYPPGKRYVAGDDYGQQGIEKQYDWELRGIRGYRDFRKRGGHRGDEMVQEHPAIPGPNLTLALHVDAQRAAENALRHSVGAAVVMDCRNGEVLVCASSPGYDLNLSGAELMELAEQHRGLLLNRAIRDAVPGGSVVKIAVAVAALQTGKASPHTTFSCGDGYHLGGLRWRCHYHGTLDLPHAIQHSCNVYFCHLAYRTGIGEMAKWARRLGLGLKTGVDLPWEQPGRFPDAEWMRRVLHRAWRPGNTLNTAIGQGDVQITPMQATVMMAAVANGGDVLWPRMLRQDSDPAPVPQPRRRVSIRPDHLAAIHQGMRAVATAGTARRVAGLAELGVAGKTGTAETPSPEINHAWFAGFAPYDSPHYAFAAVIHRTPLHGAEGAGPVIREILQVLMHGPAPEPESERTQP